MFIFACFTILETENHIGVTGSSHEPLPRPEQVVEQMRDATERLRDQAWIVAPLTTANIELGEPAPDLSAT